MKSISGTGPAIVWILAWSCLSGLQAQGPDLGASYYHFSRAKIHEFYSEYPEAVSEFEKAVALNSESAQLRVEFAETLFRVGNPERAMEEGLKAAALDPQGSAPHFLMGQIHLNSDQQDENINRDRAIAAFERAVQLDPEHFEALFYLGQLQLEKERFRAAADIFQQFLELRPWITRAYLLKAKAHLQLDETGEAIATLERSQSYEASNLEIGRQLGQLYEQTRQWEKAADLYEQLSNDVRDPEIRFRLALAYSRLERYERAVSLLEILVTDFPTNVNVRVALGEALKERRLYSRAVRVFREVLKLEPGNFTAQYRLGETLAHLGEREQAIQHFQDMLESQPSREDRGAIQTSLAFLYQDLRQYHQSVDLFRTMTREHPEDDITRLRLAYALKEAGQLPEALDLSRQLLNQYARRDCGEQPDKKYFVIGRAQILAADAQVKEALRLLEEEAGVCPDPEELYLVASQIQIDQKDFEGAENAIRVGMSRQGTTEKLQFQLAAVFERQGRYEQAETIFREILEKNPNHAGALNYLGYMLADRGLRLQESLDYIQKAVQMDPHNGAYLDSLGWVHFKLRNLEEAESNLREAARLNRTDPTIFDHLGDLYREKGNYDRAREFYEQSVVFSTEDEEREKVQEKLEMVKKLLSGMH